MVGNRKKKIKKYRINAYDLEKEFIQKKKDVLIDGVGFICLLGENQKQQYYFFRH